MPVQVRPRAPFYFWRNTQVRLKGSVLKTERSRKRRRGSNPFSSAILYLSRDGAVWSLVGLITRRSLVQIRLPQPWFVSLEAYDVCLSRRRPRVRIPYEPPSYGSIAQSVEQRTENPCVTGSIPVGATIEKFFELFELLIYIAIRNGCFFVFLITLKNKNYMLQ